MVTGLWGCSTHPQSCDPSYVDASLVAKANCLYSGAYDQRITQKRDQLALSRETNQLLKSTYAKLEMERSRVSYELASQQGQLGRIEAIIQDLVQGIESREHINQDAQLAIDALQRSIQEIKNSVAEAAVSQQPLSEMQQRHQLSELNVQVQSLARVLSWQ